MRCLVPAWVLVSVAALCASCAMPQRPDGPAATEVAVAGIEGRLLRHAAFPSRHVQARNVDVWLPPGYADDPSRRYPVLYMHDGQNLFGATGTPGGTDWGIDEAMSRLLASGEIRPAIVVAIWNTPARLAEYMPRKALADGDVTFLEGYPTMPAKEIVSDAYLAFIVEELKPFVDAHYRTLSGRDDTFTMGSSMGGLVSLYAVAEYPRVFGGAGAVSTHWPAGDGIAIAYFRGHLPAPGSHRFYFDFGTETLDAAYEPYQQRMDAAMRERGYREGDDWVTLRFEGAAHSEASWRVRVDRPLRFLLGAPRTGR
ncbi:MAG: alpha/beta hydrolase [Luteimonas sp.]|nr:alpha/beta hydrolase [Luteimonas sp.]